MNLGLFLSPGDSLTKQQRSGQLDRLINYYLKPYSREFSQVFIFSYGDSGKKFVLPSGVRLVAKPKLIPHHLYQLLLPCWQYKFIRQLDISRVFQAPGGLPALISRLLFKVPYAVSHNYDYVKFAEIAGRPLLAAVLSLVVPLVLKNSRQIITPKNIPNGVDPQIFKPANKQEKYLVLSVGRLVRQKNYQLLIKAVSLSRFKQKIKLVIIGSGPLQTQLEGLATDCGINLKIIPNLPHQQLLQWYQQAAVFALTSLIEGQPKALLEAMSCGCACLTTAFQGKADAHLLVKQLDHLLAQPDVRKKLGQQARQTIINRFDIRHLIQKEIKLLQSCAR